MEKTKGLMDKFRDVADSNDGFAYALGGAIIGAQLLLLAAIYLEGGRQHHEIETARSSAIASIDILKTTHSDFLKDIRGTCTTWAFDEGWYHPKQTFILERD